MKMTKAKSRISGTEASSRQLRAAPLWVASRTLLAGLGAEFFSLWEKVDQSFQEDDVHDLRVASRRLREGLALFLPCLPGQKTARLLKKVKKVTRMLGDLRNTDEAYLFFSKLTQEETAQSGHEVEELLSALRRERELAHLKLKKELRLLSPKPLQLQFRTIRNRPDLFGKSRVDPFMNIALFADGAITERARPLSELLPQARQEDQISAQHQLRIAAKRMRYRLEIIAPLLQRDYDRLHGALKGYQDVLGKLHDIDVFSDMVQERLQDGAGRQALLQAMAGRRRRLYRSFTEMLDSFPIDTIGERARNAL